MTDNKNIQDQCRQFNNSLGDDKNLKELPTIKLVEILYSSPNDYIGKDGRERSIEFINIFRQAYKMVKEELGRRYLADVDCKIIENAFNHTNESNKEVYISEFGNSDWHSGCSSRPLC